MPATLSIKDKVEPGELIKVAPFRKEVRHTDPHKHSQYFEVVYLSCGSGVHWIDDKGYPVKPPVLFFIKAEQVHNWDLGGESAGHVLIIKHDFLKYSEDEQLQQLLQRLWPVNCVYLHSSSNEDLDMFFELLERQPSSDNDYHKIMIEGLLKALLSKILMLVRSSGNPINKGAHLYTHYLGLLSQQSKIHRKVNYYARQLGTTSQNLNAACRKAVNQTAGELIVGQILAEAKRLLLYTDNTVSQIAYQLEFTDPSYFVKYFRKHLNVTPEAFRRQSFSK